MSNYEQQVNQIPELERTAYSSKEAGIFEIYSNRWFVDPTKPKGLLIPSFEDWPSVQKEALLRTVAQRATKLSGDTIRGDFAALKKIRSIADSEDFSIDGIDTTLMLEFFNDKSINVEIKNKLKALLLEAWELGYEGAFEESVKTIYDQFKGKRLRLNPERFERTRSLTDSERKLVYYQVARAKYLGEFTDKEYLFITVILITGKRPVQLADSKFKDFTLENYSLGKENERPVVIYNAPVAKQAGQKKRTKFNKMPIVTNFEVWETLSRVRQQAIKSFYDLLGITLTEQQSLELPVFATTSGSCIGSDHFRSKFETTEQQKLSLDEMLESTRLHPNGGDVSLQLANQLRKITVYSQYTGERLILNAKRFRHTRLTHMAYSGSTIPEIADAADHANLRSASEYVDNLPARAVKIGSQVEPTLGVLAKLFAGHEVKNSDKIINMYTKSGPDDVGRCGLDAFCKENFPVACYECELFTPNPFGNHAAVQEYVESELEKAQALGVEQLVQNWLVILIAVLERRILADQQRIKLLKESPEILKIEEAEGNHE